LTLSPKEVARLDKAFPLQRRDSLPTL